MDGSRFDDLVRLVARPATRRRTLRAVAAALGGLAFAPRPMRVDAAPDGCCKCVGKARTCMDTANKRDCRAYCGVNSDDLIVFSEHHTCTRGGPGTTLQCRLKPKTGGFEPGEPCVDDACTEEAALTGSPLTAAARDIATRASDGWATREAAACFTGDACRAGGLFGVVPGDEVTRLAAKIVDAYRHTAARRSVTPETPSDTTEDLFFRFTTRSEVAEFEANIRGLVPPDATDRSGELRGEGVSFAFSFTGATADIPVPTAETLALFARSGTAAVLSQTTSTTGSAAQRYLDREFRTLFDELVGKAPNLDLELLAASVVYLAPAAALAPIAEHAVTCLDGQTLPRDLETPGQRDFRVLTDQGTVHALRLSQIVMGTVGPVNVVHEVRELVDEEAARAFVRGSQERVQNYFGAALVTTSITEFDILGDEGTGFIYLRDLPDGGFNGGVTGYTHDGRRVGVTNVNVRTDTPPGPDLLALVQDGRYFAEPGVEILSHQLAVWNGTAPERAMPVPRRLLGR